MNDSAEFDLQHTPHKHQFALVACCFLISGFAALLYETVWLRQFAILLGTSEQALAVVLASYMGGLAVGSLVASRVVDAVRRPLLTYGLLELGVALAALFVPYGIAFAYSIQSAVLGGKPEPPHAGGLAQGLFCFGTAFGLILIPTGLMGATLPLLTRHVVKRDEELGPKIGLLYAINTAGAVLGTMFAAFVCLPALGLRQTTWIGVGANLLVFLIVLALVRNHSDVLSPVSEDEKAKLAESHRKSGGSQHARKQTKKRRGSRHEEETFDVSRYRWILPFAAISGGVSFCYEIIFTRMLGQMLGGSVYAFATMLAGFLLGIAIGGAIASRLMKSRRSAAIWFVYAQAAAAICTLLTYRLVNEMVTWPWGVWGGPSSTSVQVFASILALLPTATCIGATFPFAIRIYARNKDEAARASARVYFWNVLGGIVGAFATGILILPLMQYHGAVALAVMMNILIAIGVALVLQVKRTHLVVAAIALLVFASQFPSPPENVLRVSALTGQLTDGDFLFNHTGKSATVSVFDDTDSIIFQTNGLPESSLLPKGVGELHGHSGHWLSSLPSMIRPEAESMLIIGLGGGVAAEVIPPSIKTIDILEIEPSVVDANRVVANLRNHDPLTDSRINIILNDARNALTLTDKKYDVVVSQPSHPWTAGASHLYSREFDQIIHEHLNPGGIFLQWMNAEFIDVELTRSMGASLLDVFSHVRLYEPTDEVFMFVSSDEPMRPEAVSVNPDGPTTCRFNPQDRELFHRLGVITPTHLFSRLRLDEAELRHVCEGAEPITDERNLLAMRAPALVKLETSDVISSFLSDHLPLSRGMEVATDLCPSFDLPVYLSTVLTKQNQDWVREVGIPLLDDSAERANMEARIRRLDGQSNDYMNQLRRLATAHPDDTDLAVQILSSRLLGMPLELSEPQETQLRQALSADHRLIIELLERLVEGDLDSARAQDTKLARWSVDDVAYEWAVRLRIPWRLEAPMHERARRCNEVIDIIDRSAPFSNSAGLAFFRVSAGVRANRPDVALGTAASLSRMINESVNEASAGDVQAGISNLIRCYEILRDRSRFRSASPTRYRAVLQAVEKTLREAGVS
ncbi:MAG: fused MFS/spermidine synthase [Rubripirellula sp.]